MRKNYNRAVHLATKQYDPHTDLTYSTKCGKTSFSSWVRKTSDITQVTCKKCLSFLTVRV